MLALAKENTKLAGLKARRDSAQTEVANAETRLRAINKEVSAIKGNIKKKKEAIADLIAQIAAAISPSQTGALQVTLTTYREELKALESDLRAKRKELHSHQRNVLTPARIRLIAANAEVRKQLLVVDDAEAAVKAAKADWERVQRSYEDARRNRDNIQAEQP